MDCSHISCVVGQLDVGLNGFSNCAPKFKNFENTILYMMHIMYNIICKHVTVDQSFSHSSLQQCHRSITKCWIHPKTLYYVRNSAVHLDHGPGHGCLPTHYSTQPFCHGNQQSKMSAGSSKSSLSLVPPSSNTIPVQFRTQTHPCEWTMVKEKNAEYCDVHDVSLSFPAYFLH